MESAIATTSMNKNIDLSVLPTRKLGKREVIDWKSIKNAEVYFEYGTIKGTLLVNYSHTERGTVSNNMHYCNVSFRGKTISIADSNLRKVKLGKLLENLIEDIRKQQRKSPSKNNKWVERKDSEFKYKVGDVIHKERTNFIVVSSFRNKPRNNKAYLIECSVCNQQFEREEYEVSRSKNCPICFNSVVVTGFNDVATTHPWVLEYAVDKDVLSKNSFGSAEKVFLQCPTCKKARSMKITDLIKYNFRCSCQTSSTGEQILEACLRVNNINYQKEYSLPNSRKRYDFFLEKHNLIIEVHGAQHYKQIEGWGELSETQANDKKKKEEALCLGYTYVELNWSHTNIAKLLIEIREKLSFITSLNIYQELDLLPTFKKLVKIWEEHPYNTNKLEEELKIGATSRKKLLKQARDLGLIEYDSRYAQTKSHIKQVVCLNERRVYSSIKEAAIIYEVDRKAISGNCKNNSEASTRFKSAGKHPLTNEKLQWMFLEDYLEAYSKENLIFMGDKNTINKGE